MDRDRHLVVLRRVGIALITVEALNIVWSLFVDEGHISPSLDLSAIVGGIYLIRGSLTAARVVRWFSAFVLALMIPPVIGIPFWIPPAFLTTALRLQPRSIVVPTAVVVLLFAVLFGILSELTSEPVEQALAGSPGKPWKLPLAWLSGAALGTVVAVLCLGFVGGRTAEEAIARAREANGPAYRYFVSSLSTATRNGERHVSATVVAFNAEEIRECPVSWDD